MSQEKQIAESDASFAAGKEKEKEKRLTSKDQQTLSKLRAMMSKEKKPVKEETISEEHTVHVSDGSKYGDKPHEKDVEHVMAGVKKHNGKYDGSSDKGAYFKFSSKGDADAFKKHVDKCPKNTCHADLHEEVEQIDEISSDLAKKARDAAFAKGKDDQAFRFVKKAYEKGKKESDAIGKKMAEEVAANNVGSGNIAGTQGDAGKKPVMTKQPLKRKKLEDFKEYVELEEKGLWDNIHAKRKRIKAGSGERMRKPGSKGAPTEADFKSASESVEISEKQEPKDYPGKDGHMWHPTGKTATHAATGKKTYEYAEVDKEGKRTGARHYKDINGKHMGESVEIDEAAIDAKGHKSSTGGLTQKGVDAYRRANPGSKLQTAVTTPPSKLDPDSKAAKRRKSFCARMSGVDGPMKDEKGRPTRKALALKKWNC